MNPGVFLGKKEKALLLILFFIGRGVVCGRYSSWEHLLQELVPLSLAQRRTMLLLLVGVLLRSNENRLRFCYRHILEYLAVLAGGY
ncbi:hypothetical protein CDAR_452421 [Caerostris darwini]|uniref:Secreted protein n=1 Tax=Caerostris darwini TaxID=1538125 RepID=A0AAV4VQZ6_9ARAC|nr:hypothetical protein CDAR_452421 [Caerostris darwini]